MLDPEGVPLTDYWFLNAPWTVDFKHSMEVGQAPLATAVSMRISSRVELKPLLARRIKAVSVPVMAAPIVML